MLNFTEKAMAKKRIPLLTKVLKVNLSPLEYEKIILSAHQTACRSMSDYARRIIFDKPITMLYRNLSVDDAVETCIEMIEMIKKVLVQPTLSEKEKIWLQEKIYSLEEITIKIFNLCSQSSNVTETSAGQSTTTK